MQILEKGYGIMPNTVLFDSELSSTAKLLFVYISSLCASRGYCFASNEHFSEKFGLSSSQISRLISSLSGHLEIENGSNEKRRIRLRKNAEVPTQKPQGSLRKNAEHNNTNRIVQANNKSIAKAIPKEALLIAQRMAVSVVDNFSFMAHKLTQKDHERWAKDIDRLHRIDGYPYELICMVMDWSQQDDFWRQQIRSGANLRKHFETLLVRMKSQKERIAVIS